MKIQIKDTSQNDIKRIIIEKDDNSTKGFKIEREDLKELFLNLQNEFAT